MPQTPYPCGLPSGDGSLIEACPRPPSRFPWVLRAILDLYADPNEDSALYLEAAGGAIEQTWALVDGTHWGSDVEVGPRTLHYALESLVRWQTAEQVVLSDDFRWRFTSMSAAIRQYCRLDPADPLPEPDPPLECLLMEVGWLLDALWVELKEVWGAQWGTNPMLEE